MKDNTLTLLVALLGYVVAPTLLDWRKRRRADAAKREVNRFDVMQRQFELRLLEQHCDDLESILKRICERFHAGEEINKYDVDAIENEIAQRPKKSTFVV